MLYQSPAVEEFTIAWCMLIAHTHEGLNNHGRVIVLTVPRRTCYQVCGLVTPCRSSNVNIVCTSFKVGTFNSKTVDLSFKIVDLLFSASAPTALPWLRA